MTTAAALTGTDAIAPSFVTPLSFAAGIILFVVLVAALGGAANLVRYLRAAHVRGMARVDAADQAAANRRARAARRTVVDVDTDGTITGITTARRGR